MRAHSASASRVWLLEKCAWWAQKDTEHYEGPTNEAAAHGTAVHQLVHEAWVGKKESKVQSPSTTAQKQAALVLDWLRKNAPSLAISEVPLIYNVATDTTLQAGEPGDYGHRAYGHVRATEIPGTPDIMWHDARENQAVVVDIKTGWAVDAAEGSLQLATLGLAASRLFGVQQALVGHLRVDDDKAWIDWHTLGAIDLDATRRLLARLLHGIEGTPTPTPGPHCAWCPARTSCPETKAMTAALPNLLVATTKDVQRIYPQLKPMRDMLDQIEARIEAFVAKHGTVQVGDEHELTFVQTGGGESVSIKGIPDDMASTLRALGVIKERAKGRCLKLVKTGVKRKRTGT